MLANSNSLSIEMELASSPVEVLEYRMGFASGPVEVPEQGDRFDMALVLFSFDLFLERVPKFKLNFGFRVGFVYDEGTLYSCFVFDSSN